MSQKILLFDTETSGLCTKESRIMEVAWATFDLFNWRVIKAQSYLLKWGMHYDVEDEAFRTTGLTRIYCENRGVSANLVFTQFLLDLGETDYIGGHNAIPFDIPMMESNLKRAMFTDPTPGLGKHAIDSLIDCPFPAHQKIHALKYLALDHGYILSGAHQALADVFACAHILQSYPFEKVLEISKTPIITLTARAGFQDHKLKQRIRNARMYWNAEKKHYERRIREYFLAEIQKELSL